MNSGRVSVSSEIPTAQTNGPVIIYQRRDHLMADQTDNGKTLGQQYYEAVEALKAQGVPNAEAVRQVAAQHGKQENAVRGGLHQYKSKLNGGSEGGTLRRRGRSASASVDDLVASARQSLERAVALIDDEVAQAKAALDAAQARYDEVVSSVKERKADVERKLKALA